LRDRSVCSLRDIRRVNSLFLWFFNSREAVGTYQSVIESITLALAQCYYYRLNVEQRFMYGNAIQQKLVEKSQQHIEFEQTVEQEQWRYVRKLDVSPGIALNLAFRENLFVILVALATKTPTIVVGRPGSSKTLAMATLQANLASSSKNKALTQMGFDDFFVVSFQCSKLTTADLIKKRWEIAVSFRERLEQLKTDFCLFVCIRSVCVCVCMTRENENIGKKKKKKKKRLSEDDRQKTPLNKGKEQANKSVVLVLDEVGLAEQSKHRPLKVLHQLLEEEDRKIAFIGLSNWKLDAAKMNRVVLHQVMQPNQKELEQTAQEIISSGEETPASCVLVAKIPQMASLYDSIMKDHDSSPFKFDFFGYRDFYSLCSYLKYCVEIRKDVSKDVLIEAVMRNFGGMTKEQTESFLFPKISKNLLDGDLLNGEDIWETYSPLRLIDDNIRQTRMDNPPSNEMRNIMLITESPFMWKVLFDKGIASPESTDVIFGSKFAGDIDSTVYLYRTIEKVRTAMSAGRLCLLLKLEQLYDSLYDVLNQRYQVVDGQKCVYFLFLYS
ncbi:hypothetical protein RFI_16499, partial [Reticulomyxa filosa]